MLLWLAWRVNVAYVLVHPVSRSGGARVREDSMLAIARRVERRKNRRIRRLLAGRKGPRAGRNARAVVAVRSRAIRYWFADPRYLAAILSVSVFPILFFFLVYPAYGSPIYVIVAIPVLLAGTIGWGRHNDIAYDSTALWLDVVAGRLGRALMWGRVTATLVWAIPVVAAGTIAAVVVGGRPDLTPGVVGASLGVLGTSLGVSAVTSVALPYRAPAPGENPFSAQVGSVGAGLLAQAISSAVAWTVAVPVVFPLVAALLWENPAWGWVGLVTGTATGLACLVLGVRWAGTLYDRKSGRLVAAVS
jgi:ABC-2 type transport system permease protein